jgi:hypothetical protein
MQNMLVAVTQILENKWFLNKRVLLQDRYVDYKANNKQQLFHGYRLRHWHSRRKKDHCVAKSLHMLHAAMQINAPHNDIPAAGMTK